MSRHDRFGNQKLAFCREIKKLKKFFKPLDFCELKCYNDDTIE